MHLIAAFAALGLLVVVLFPFVSTRLRAARRGRAVHLGGSCHWYANYDEELRYEPKRRSDIVRLTRSEVLARGYRPTDDVQIVPRTFRHRVPGDTKVRLWRSEGAAPLWLCEWATDPVRVSIGVGERERVPGVESIPLADGMLDAHAGKEMRSPVLGSWDAAASDRELEEIALRSAEAADWSALEREQAIDVEGAARPTSQATAVEPQREPEEPAEPVTSEGEASADDAFGLAPTATSMSDDDAPPPASGRQRKKRRRRRR